MSRKQLHVSPDLALPLDAATETFGIMGRRGSGKSHTGSVMAEEMLKAGVPIIAYDPTGVWYGLKSSVDGKNPGFPVVIFGGDHEDVPLSESDGEMVASAIVAERFPAILDCSLMRKAARLRFMADFLETLYHRNREAVHFFVDEIHTVAPLTLRNVGEAAVFQSRCVGAIEDIILQGRRRGLGLTGLSLRPALVNANVRSQFGTLIAMKLVAPLDRKAIGEWIQEKGTEEEGQKLLEQLPRLARGTGIVWSPTFDLLKTVQFRPRETFDSGRTPSVGERRIEPKVWAEIDVNKLGETIAQKREEKKANDPAALKRRIGELERLVAKKPDPKPTPPPPKVTRVEVPVVTATMVKRVEGVVSRLEAEGKRRLEAAEVLRRSGEQLVGTAREFTAALLKASAAPSTPKLQPPPPNPSRPGPVAPPVRPRDRHTPLAGTVADVSSREQLDGPARKILDAYAFWHSIGVERPRRENVAPLAGYSHIRSSGFRNPLYSLQAAGLIQDDGLTEQGRKLAEWPSRTHTLEEYHAKLKSVMEGPEVRLFDLLNAAGGHSTREALATAAGYGHVRSSGFRNPLYRLSSMGLVAFEKGEVVRGTELMYPPTLVSPLGSVQV